MVDFHGGVGEGAKDGDDGDFPDGHLTNGLQVLVPLLDVHLVFLARRRDQLQGQGKRRSGAVRVCACTNYTHTVRCIQATLMYAGACRLSTGRSLPSARWNSNHDSAALL